MKLYTLDYYISYTIYVCQYLTTFFHFIKKPPKIKGGTERSEVRIFTTKLEPIFLKTSEIAPPARPPPFGRRAAGWRGGRPENLNWLGRKKFPGN
jgi:hypothetical protein